MNQIIESETEIDVSPQQILGESEIQIRTAKMYPRDMKKVIQEAELLATFNEESAASCVYSVPRGGKMIVGASVRLAEIISSAWGNIHASTRISDNDGYYITAEAFCWDLEKNVRIGTQVKRNIRDKYGKPYSPDMRTVAENAAISIALRNAIFKVIPKTYVDVIFDKCQKMIATNGNEEKFLEKRKNVFLRFNEMGVETSKILSFFKKDKIENLDVTDITNLIGIGTAIKEGHLKAEEAFYTGNTKSDELAVRLEQSS